MTTYDTEWNEVEDTSKGTVETVTKPLIASYVVTQEGEGEYVTIAEYDNDGKDVEWRWTVEPIGEWVFKQKNNHKWDKPPKPEVQSWWSKEQSYACTVEYQLYTPYTEEELQQQADEAAAQAEAKEEAQAQADMVAALPDAVAELAELAADNSTNIDDIADALAELSQLVAELAAANE